MKRIAFLLILVVSACTQVEVPVPEHTLSVALYTPTLLTEVWSEGYRCRLDGERIEPVAERGTTVYYNLPPGTYCVVWLDPEGPYFHYYFNGEPAQSQISCVDIVEIEDKINFSTRQCVFQGDAS